MNTPFFYKTQFHTTRGNTYDLWPKQIAFARSARTDELIRSLLANCCWQRTGPLVCRYTPTSQSTLWRYLNITPFREHLRELLRSTMLRLENSPGHTFVDPRNPGFNNLHDGGAAMRRSIYALRNSFGHLTLERRGMAIWGPSAQPPLSHPRPTGFPSRPSKGPIT